MWHFNVNSRCSTSPPPSSARHSSPPGKPTQAQTSWTEPPSALRSLKEQRHFNKLSPGRWSTQIRDLRSVLYLASCPWASGSSSCVGRRNQTATRRRSAPAPSTRPCRGTRRPGRILSAHREGNNHIENLQKLWVPSETSGVRLRRLCPPGGGREDDSPWPEAPWRPPALLCPWWACALRPPPRLARCILSWAERPNPACTNRKWHHCRFNTRLQWRLGVFFVTLWGSCELKGLHSRK